MSRIIRDESIRTAKKSTKTARKELEKVNESARKSITAKLQPTSNSPLDVGEFKEEGKEVPGDKKKKVEIDWKNLKNFPTYDFPKER